MMSCPLIATGSVMAWMGNGWVMPESSSAATISGRTPKSANVTFCAWMADGEE